MKIKKSYKMLAILCVVLLSMAVITDTSLVKSIAEIGGGVMEDSIHIIPFIF